MKSTADSKFRRRLKIPNELGLHARAAASIARLAEEAQSTVLIEKDGQRVDVTNILDVMALYCPYGTELTVEITDPADLDVLNKICRLIESGFGEL